VELIRSIPLVVKDIFPVDAAAGTVAVMEVALEVKAVTGTPLMARFVIVPKFVPVMVTEAPTAPLAGLNPVKAGVCRTVKSVALIRLIPLVVKDIFPVDAPAGTVAVMDVALEVKAVTGTPLMARFVIVPKFVPLMVTDEPGAPFEGLNPVSVGVSRTVKSVALIRFVPFVVKEIFPVVAPPGTVALIVVALDVKTVTGTPLMARFVIVPKFVPVIVTEAPTAPFAGLKDVMAGISTTKFTGLTTVTPLVVTDTVPV